MECKMLVSLACRTVLELPGRRSGILGFGKYFSSSSNIKSPLISKNLSPSRFWTGRNCITANVAAPGASSLSTSSQALWSPAAEPPPPPNRIMLNSRDQVDDFLKVLSDDQRRLIYQSLHVEVLREKYMNELASESHYLSRFGRPTTSLTHGGVEDPTGSFTEISPKWLSSRLDVSQQEAPTTDEAKTQSHKVQSRDLFSVGLKNALPFIGFGFLDNLIMIVAGDYIDLTIGAALGISTMAAAALGNTISDVAGIASVWYVEFFAHKIGLPEPKLSAAQLASTGVRWSCNLGRALGVVIGCLLGMLPLLFLTTGGGGDKEGKEKKEKREK